MIMLLAAAPGLTLAVSEWHNTVIVVAMVATAVPGAVIRSVRPWRAIQ
jgi:hypothetical protein